MTAGGRVAFVVSGGPGVGLGHVRRATALAQALREHALTPVFLVDGPDQVLAFVRAMHFDATSVPIDHDGAAPAAAASAVGACGIVADSYRLTPEAFRRAASTGAYVSAIDDLADRVLPVDMVINGGVGSEALRYDVPASAELLLGSAYALLRPELWHSRPKKTSNAIRTVFVSVGGDDPRGMLPALVHAARRAVPSARIDVIVPPLSTAQADRDFGEGVVLHHNPADIVDLMHGADAAISAGGQTAYELAACGVPTVGLCLFDNQRPSLEAMAEAGILVYPEATGSDAITRRAGDALAALDQHVDQRSAMAARAQSLVDGGGARRVAAVLAVRLSGDLRCQDSR